MPEWQTYDPTGGVMSSMRYTEVNKAEALKQVTERGHSAHEVTGRLGM